MGTVGRHANGPHARTEHDTTGGEERVRETQREPEHLQRESDLRLQRLAPGGTSKRVAPDGTADTATCRDRRKEARGSTGGKLTP